MCSSGAMSSSVVQLRNLQVVELDVYRCRALESILQCCYQLCRALQGIHTGVKVVSRPESISEVSKANSGCIEATLSRSVSFSLHVVVLYMSSPSHANRNV